MVTVEEESSEGGSVVTQRLVNISGHSSMSSEAEEGKKSKKKPAKEKKGPAGIIKGLLRYSFMHVDTRDSVFLTAPSVAREARVIMIVCCLHPLRIICICVMHHHCQKRV